MALGFLVLLADSSFAQSPPTSNVPAQAPATRAGAAPSSDADRGAGKTPAALVTCSSEPGGRGQCAADTSAGVALVKSTEASACLLGKTWGDDSAGVWVADGCGGESQLGQSASPVCSAFGHYIGGQEGTTYAVGVSVFF